VLYRKGYVCCSWQFGWRSCCWCCCYCCTFFHDHVIGRCWPCRTSANPRCLHKLSKDAWLLLDFVLFPQRRLVHRLRISRSSQTNNVLIWQHVILCKAAKQSIFNACACEECMVSRCHHTRLCDSTQAIASGQPGNLAPLAQIEQWRTQAKGP